ncbi:DUF397 domain-containing protein [Streptomyces sp. NPDC047043]|uniref:DUF397 domain-containing protein n=1 Tax=Streptomyces sp. NPDC047043 TaxID=3154497 RepID=UPI0033D87E36
MREPLAWQQSSYSTSGATCVEVCWAVPFVWVRDSKDATRPPLRISLQGWEHFREALYPGRVFSFRSETAGGTTQRPS